MLDWRSWRQRPYEVSAHPRPNSFVKYTGRSTCCETEQRKIAAAGKKLKPARICNISWGSAVGYNALPLGHPSFQATANVKFRKFSIELKEMVISFSGEAVSCQRQFNLTMNFRFSFSSILKLYNIILRIHGLRRYTWCRLQFSMVHQVQKPRDYNLKLPVMRKSSKFYTSAFRYFGWKQEGEVTVGIMLESMVRWAGLFSVSKLTIALEKVGKREISI